MTRDLSLRRCPYFDASVKRRSPPSSAAQHFVAGMRIHSGKEVAPPQERLTCAQLLPCVLES
jgi:hypothetical protein